MKSRQAKTQYLKRLEEAGLSLDELTAAVGIESMLAFYAEERADDCDLEEDGDMLLFQWGLFDWGKGEFLEINITRQFIGDAEEPRQLSLTFQFDPACALKGLKDGKESTVKVKPDGEVVKNFAFPKKK